MAIIKTIHGYVCNVEILYSKMFSVMECRV